MAKKAYVRNSQNTEWVEIASSIANINLDGYLTESSASTIYATKTELENIDLSIENIDLSAYLTNSSASNTYLTQSDASNLYITQNSASSTYLTQISASITYATKDELNSIDLSSASAAAVAAITESTSATLDALNELAAALNDDENFAASVTESLGDKLDISTASSTYQTIVENVSNTEIGYLDGVTSSIQTQLNSKASFASPTFSGTVVSPTLRLTSTANASPASTDHAFQIGQNNSGNIKIDTNEILSFNNNANQDLHIQTYGGHVLFGTGVVDGTSAGIQVHGPLRLESSRNAANNTRGIASMRSKIAVNSANNRQELQIYASGDAYSANSAGGGIHLYGTNDSQHAGNIAFLTGTPNNGDARMIIAGGTGATGYVSDGVTYTRTNNDTRVTIGNFLWNWVDEKRDTGLLNLKDASARPAIYIESSGASDGTTYGTIGIETGRNFGIGHWSGSSFTRRFSISSAGNSTFAGNAIPSSSGTRDLGTTGLRWRNLYLQDLHLSNGIGDYTVIEGEEDLFLVNNKSGKSFKFALIEVDSSVVPPKSASGSS
jgi:hypothetical protein